MNVLKKGGLALAVFIALSALAYLIHSDPIGPLAGRALRGSEAPYPSDWSFSNAHRTIALEVRPDAPHSVTTICFVHDGALFVPAQAGSNKAWTHYVLADPLVRIKIADRVYPARAVRVTELEPKALIASATKKYAQLAERMGDELPADMWLFRIEPR